MEIILRQDYDELGLEGDIVKVTKGYARNYLIPKGLALEASPQNIKSLEQQRKKIEIRRLKAKGQAEAMKSKLEELVINLTQKAGEEGKLYGSVTTMDIASDLEKKGFIIDKRKILMERPIKTLGEYNISIRVYPEVTAALQVVVAPEEVPEG